MSNNKTIVMMLIVVASFHSLVAAQEDRAAAVERRLRESIREIGVLESAQTVDVRSRVSGQAALLFIIESGAQVRKGDLVAELDDAALRERMQEKQVVLAQAEADLESARSKLTAIVKEGALTVEIAKGALSLAISEKERQFGEHGQLAVEIVEVNSAIAIAEAQLKMAEERLAKRLGDDQKGNKLSELQFTRSQAREQLKALFSKKRFLEGPQRKHLLATVEQAIKIAESELLAAKNNHEAKAASAKAELVATEAALEVAQEQYQSVREQVARCRIVAPVDGVAMHVAPSGRNARSSLEAGAMIRERQLLIRFPDLSQLQMRVNVNESKIAEVEAGQKARVVLDALPDKAIDGVVTRVNKFAEPTSWLSRSVREYSVIVKFSEAPKLARLGLTGMVEIETGGGE